MSYLHVLAIAAIFHYDRGVISIQGMLNVKPSWYKFYVNIIRLLFSVICSCRNISLETSQWVQNKWQALVSVETQQSQSTFLGLSGQYNLTRTNSRLPIVPFKVFSRQVIHSGICLLGSVVCPLRQNWYRHRFKVNLTWQSTQDLDLSSSLTLHVSHSHAGRYHQMDTQTWN